MAVQEKYEVYTNGNEFLTITEPLQGVSTRTIFLFTADVVTRRIMNASRETMEEALTCLQIFPKILTR